MPCDTILFEVIYVDTRQKIKSSAEARAYRGGFKVLTAAYLFLLIFMAALVFVCMSGFPERRNALLLVFFGVLTVWYGPFAVYYGVKYAALFKSPESYVFSDQVLEEFEHAGLLGNRVTFRVTVRDAGGNPVKVQTRPIYCTNWKRPRYGDFFRKEVTVGYNAATGEVILIAK